VPIKVELARQVEGCNKRVDLVNLMSIKGKCTKCNNNVRADEIWRVKGELKRRPMRHFKRAHKKLLQPHYFQRVLRTCVCELHHKIIGSRRDRVRVS